MIVAPPEETETGLYSSSSRLFCAEVCACVESSFSELSGKPSPMPVQDGRQSKIASKNTIIFFILFTVNYEKSYALIVEIDRLIAAGDVAGEKAYCPYFIIGIVARRYRVIIKSARALGSFGGFGS